MQVYVEPAKRAGRRKLISEAQLTRSNVDRSNDCILLTFEAAGLYDASRYRYTLKLSPESIATLRGYL
ncbi:hypothetical protein FY036_21140 [Mesorhizobium microcysteis]|jgi:hypothetical protein|uniref:Uncharacterized protein n=1 Tax=Neoaquamicrobium microcysteis TaxID=2682781 RepID=A0A5D4GML7_9HYPH|nr:hypothetical protein [Mesorhizobium microcysteis]TYR29384.1 hypothetical protein FY036_21140 [Mesorhizobium microcysteis]